MSRFIGLQPEPSDIAASGIWDIGDVADYESVEVTGQNRWPTNESYVHIARARAASGALSLVFNNIPQGFDDLLLVGGATFANRAPFTQNGDLFFEVNYTSSSTRASRYLAWNITPSGFSAGAVTGTDGSVLLTAIPIAPGNVSFDLHLTNYRNTSRVQVRAEVTVMAGGLAGESRYFLSGSIDTDGQPVTNLQLSSDYLQFSTTSPAFNNEINIYGMRRVYS